MPRLSKARFVRLEYNWKKSIVSDETFDFRGEPTLLKMQNGGGKSVLTQMLLSAYISARKRNFHARPFSEYFSGPKPTFLLQEWIKDSNAGYFCVGQMIRKSQTVRENEIDTERLDSRLDHIVWIAEYADAGDEMALSNLMLTEQQANGRRAFMSYAKAKTQLESLARSRPHDFRIYNMNDSSQRKAYYERLENLGIRLSEMDQLREFNQEESGISKFNGTYSTEDKLIRKVFIPAITQRLDVQAGAQEKKGHIELFRESFASLLEEKSRNHENLILADILQHLIKDLENAQALSQHRTEEKRRLDRILIKLRLLYDGIQQAGTDFDLQETELEEYWEECQQELIRIIHQILSMQFHDNHQLLEKTAADLKTLAAKQEEARHRIVLLEEKGHRLNCASELASLHKYESEERAARKKMEAARLSSEEISRKQEHIGAALNLLYHEDFKTITKELDEQTELLDQQQEELKQHQIEIREARKAQVELVGRASSLRTCMNSYQKEEKKFLISSHLSLAHSLSFWEDHDVYEHLSKTLEIELQEAEDRVQSLQREAESSRNLQDKAEKKIRELSDIQNTFEHRIEDGQKQRIILEDRRKLRENMLAILGLQPEDLWNDRTVEQATKQTVERIRFSIQSINSQISDFERKLRQLSTGTALDLSEDVLSVMEELGIEVRTGTDLLRNWNLPAEKKEQLIADHPFLPYSLIMDDEQMEGFVQALQQKGINTSMPIPLQSRDSLNHQESQLTSPRFYLRFNTQLIYAEELEKLKQQTREELDSWKKEIAERQSELEMLQIAWAQVQQNPVTQKEFTELGKTLAALEKKRQQTLDDLSSQELLKQKERIHEQGIIRQEKEAAKEAEKKRRLFGQFRTLMENYQEAVQCWHELEETEEKQSTLTVQLQEMERQENQKRQQLNTLERKNESSRKQKDEIRQLCSQFSRFQDKEPAQGNRLDLEADYESLQMKLNQTQSGIFAQQMEVARKNKEEKQEILNRKMNVWNLNLSEIETIDFSDDLSFENDSELAGVRSELEKLAIQFSHKSRQQGKYEANEQNLLKQILEQVGQSSPLELNQISSENLEQEKEEVETDSELTRKKLDKLRSKHAQFDQAGKRLHEFEGLEKIVLSDQENVPDLKELSISELELQMNELKTSWKQQKSLLDTSSKALKNSLEERLRNYQRKNELAEQAIAAILARIDDLQGTEEEIDQKKKFAQAILVSTQTNLEKLQKKKDEVVQNLFSYIRAMNQQMKMIDMDTTVQIGHKHRKMLEITMPDWESHEAMYREKLRQYIDDGLDRLEKNSSDQDSQIYTLVEPANLFHSVVGIHTLRIRLYKIEELSQSRIDWHQAGKLSGAEGFLCALTVILAVLNYQHRTNADLLTGRRGSSLLLLDNPFAYTQSAHIIDTMMKLADNMNTQIVAFTNVDNAAVLNAFGNIISLRMIPRYDGRNYLNVTSTAEPGVREAESVQVLLQ